MHINTYPVQNHRRALCLNAMAVAAGHVFWASSAVELFSHAERCAELRAAADLREARKLHAAAELRADAEELARTVALVGHTPAKQPSGAEEKEPAEKGADTVSNTSSATEAAEEAMVEAGEAVEAMAVAQEEGEERTDGTKKNKAGRAAKPTTPIATPDERKAKKSASAKKRREEEKAARVRMLALKANNLGAYLALARTVAGEPADVAAFIGTKKQQSERADLRAVMWIEAGGKVAKDGNKLTNASTVAVAGAAGGGAGPAEVAGAGGAGPAAAMVESKEDRAQKAAAARAAAAAAAAEDVARKAAENDPGFVRMRDTLRGLEGKNREDHIMAQTDKGGVRRQWRAVEIWVEDDAFKTRLVPLSDHERDASVRAVRGALRARFQKIRDTFPRADPVADLKRAPKAKQAQAPVDTEIGDATRTDFAAQTLKAQAALAFRFWRARQRRPSAMVQSEWDLLRHAGATMGVAVEEYLKDPGNRRRIESRVQDETDAANLLSTNNILDDLAAQYMMLMRPKGGAKNPGAVAPAAVAAVPAPDATAPDAKNPGAVAPAAVAAVPAPDATAPAAAAAADTDVAADGARGGGGEDVKVAAASGATLGRTITRIHGNASDQARGLLAQYPDLKKNNLCTATERGLETDDPVQAMCIVMASGVDVRIRYDAAFSLYNVFANRLTVDDKECAVVLLGRTDRREFIVSENPDGVITEATLLDGEDHHARALVDALTVLDGIVHSGV